LRQTIGRPQDAQGLAGRDDLLPLKVKATRKGSEAKNNARKTAQQQETRRSAASCVPADQSCSK
jgi:hypothetical protein